MYFPNTKTQKDNQRKIQIKFIYTDFHAPKCVSYHRIKYGRQPLKQTSFIIDNYLLHSFNKF